MELKSEKQLFKVSQKALFYDADQQKFLLLKSVEKKPGTIPAHYKAWRKKYGPYDLPGGRIDEGEEVLKDSFIREISEEIGFEISGEAYVVHTQKMRHGESDHSVLNTISLVRYEGQEIELSDEHDEYEWMSAEEIENDKNVKSWIKDAVVKAHQMVEMKESLSNWQRCLADFDNYKKRQSENQKDFTKYAAEGVISDMLPVLDNFHAATEHIPADQSDNPWVTGIMFIQQQMEKVFEESDVKKIPVKIGDEFDPNIMEAIKNDDEEELSEDAKVVKVAQHGYMIGEKVLRPARVVLK